MFSYNLKGNFMSDYNCNHCGTSHQGHTGSYCSGCGNSVNRAANSVDHYAKPATCCQCGGRGMVDNPDREEAAITGLAWMSCYHCNTVGLSRRDCCTATNIIRTK